MNLKSRKKIKWYRETGRLNLVLVSQNVQLLLLSLGRYFFFPHKSYLFCLILIFEDDREPHPFYFLLNPI